eukprot:scaffold22355_cov57-Cyclotella_meneghiniana.AAC.2
MSTQKRVEGSPGEVIEEGTGLRKIGTSKGDFYCRVAARVQLANIFVYKSTLIGEPNDGLVEKESNIGVKGVRECPPIWCGYRQRCVFFVVFCSHKGEGWEVGQAPEGKSSTFEELANDPLLGEGRVRQAMSESFGFVSSEAGVYNDVTESTIASDYNVAASVPPAPAA